jgi:plastocyanin
MKRISVILCAIVSATLIGGGLYFSFNQLAWGQIGSMSTFQNLGADYAVSIIPGAAQKDSPYHYYPPAIAVPGGTTVAWFNNDLGQPHTVTSGNPGSSDSGRIFNSGIMPASANSFFEYTFGETGNFTYHCEIHPWRVAIVSVNNLREIGKNFVLSSGVGPIWNLSKDFRTLLEFAPISISLDKSTPIKYNVTFFKNGAENVFSGAFVTNGEPLNLELIKGMNETRVYGPDFSSTGTYHLEGPFLKDDSFYNIKVEITAINSKPPANQISDDRLTLKTIT